MRVTVGRINAYVKAGVRDKAEKYLLSGKKRPIFERPVSTGGMNYRTGYCID